MSKETFDCERVRAAATRMRRDIVCMLGKAGSGHPGGSLSAADFVATLFFGGTLRHDPSRPRDPARDRFILSKGHAAPVLYAALALDGYFPGEWLDTLRTYGSHLQGHPDMRKCPGVEVSTGSLGQGLSIGAGMALGLLQDHASLEASAQGAASTAQRCPRVFVLLGDGELQEGQVWEAVLFAAHRKLNNLIAIVDNNNLQIDGHLDEVVGLGSIAAKFASFGWRVLEVQDGNDVCACQEALDAATRPCEDPASAPCAIVLHTIKGKGVSFMEDQAGWHGKAPNAREVEQALAELDAYSAHAKA